MKKLQGRRPIGGQQYLIPFLLEIEFQAECESFFILDPGSSQLPATAVNKLKDIAKDMIGNPAARLEVRTYSPAKPHSEGTARRLSLSRFLAIRAFLIANGVDDDSIDGRPLASLPTELNADRAELYIEQ